MRKIIRFYIPRLNSCEFIGDIRSFDIIAVSHIVSVCPIPHIVLWTSTISSRKSPHIHSHKILRSETFTCPLSWWSVGPRRWFMTTKAAHLYTSLCCKVDWFDFWFFMFRKRAKRVHSIWLRCWTVLWCHCIWLSLHKSTFKTTSSNIV